MSLLNINLVNAQPANIRCKRGDTFLFETLRFWSDTAKTVPIDISGHTFAMEVKDADDVVILTFAGASEFVVSGAGDNYLTVTKAAADMLVDASPDGEPYKYDLEMTDGSGVVSTIMKGNFTIEQDVTNAD
jgi:hypothetical protein